MPKTKTSTTKKTAATKHASRQPAGTPVALLTADLHLQPRAWADRRRVQGDAYWAFRQIVALARQYDVPIIAAGDILDTKRHDTSTPSDLQELFSALGSDVDFYYVQGDHDRLDKPWLSVLLPTLPTVKHLPAYDVTDINGVNFQGFDWQAADELQNALTRVSPAVSVLVMHQTLEELTGGLYVGELTAAQVPHVPMLLIGDIHKTKLLSCTGASGQTLSVVSPGSPCKQSIDEADEKSVYLLERLTDGTLRVKACMLRQRVTLRYTVYDEDDVERVVGCVGTDIAAAIEKLQGVAPAEIADYPLIAVEVDRRQAPNWRRILRAVNSRAEVFRLWRESYVDGETAEAAVIDDATCLDVVSGGMPAAIRQYVTDSEQRELLLRLWQSPNPAKELQALTALATE